MKSKIINVLIISMFLLTNIAGFTALGINGNISNSEDSKFKNNEYIPNNLSDSDGDGVTNRYALIIGTDSMVYCDNDADDMSDVLEDSGWTVKVYKNSKATKLNILNGIQWLADKSDTDDIVLFYFSGHGATRVISDCFGGPIFLIELKIAFSAISSSTIQVLIFDTCHAGSMVVGADNPDFKLKFYNYDGDYPDNDEEFETSGFFGFCDTGRVVIASCRGFQYSYGDPQFKNGIFTYYFVEGLKQKSTDTNGNGWVSATEALEYAKPKTKERAAKHSLLGQWPTKVKDTNLGQVDLSKIGNGRVRVKIFSFFENLKILNQRIIVFLKYFLK